jgi:multidrug resistance efflux pump
MELLLILTYTAICVAVFKALNIPVNRWSIPTAVLGGAFMTGTIIVAMNYNHPYSEISRQYFVTTPIVPAVSGLVVSVAASNNRKLQAGDELFSIDSAPFRNRVNAIRPQLAMAREDLFRAKENLEKAIGKQRDVDLATAQMENLEAQLATARFELGETVMRAPTNGYVTQVALRPGMMAKSLPFRAVMVFVHDEDHYYVGWFRQNGMLQLEKGNPAEVAFDGLPGRVFKGVVDLMLPAIAEGQVMQTGNLMGPGQASSPGRIPVLIKITDPEFERFADRIPGGAFAQTAIYSDHAPLTAVIRKILLRMASWLSYLFPFH